MFFWHYDMMSAGWWLCKSSDGVASSKEFGPFNEPEAELAGAIHGVPFFKDK